MRRFVAKERAITMEKLNMKLATVRTSYEEQPQTHKAPCMVMEIGHTALEEWLKQTEALLAQAQQESQTRWEEIK